jgi:sugar fermentation stimulation protein A
MKQAGHRFVLFFLIQRSDGKLFEPAKEIDPIYANTLQNAVIAGVEVLCYRAEVRMEGIEVSQKIKKINF